MSSGAAAAASNNTAASPSLLPLAGVKILAVVPQAGFDPTEVAVPFASLTAKGAAFTFAVPDPTAKAACDPIMIDGVGLGPLKWSMRADENGRAAYSRLEDSKLLCPPHTISYETALQTVDAFDALLLPGGHCPAMVPYLESKLAFQIVAAFNGKADKSKNTIAAICHGVVLAGRAGILEGKNVTALERWFEETAHKLTKWWMGNYYKTYADRTVESEVTLQCKTKSFVKGPWGFGRDSSEKPNGFFVRDGNLITARWPGDAHAFANEFGRVIIEKRRETLLTTTAPKGNASD